MSFLDCKKMKLENYYLAYFDILGYKSFFEKGKDPYAFLSVIQNAIEDMKKDTKIPQLLNNVNVGFKAYSDNFLFYIKDDDNQLQAIAALSYLIQQIQRRLLEKYSILIRGGITKGEFYVNMDFVFGKGIINVYALESNFPIYPRIILDEKNIFSIDTLKSLEDRGFISKDEDNLYYIQYLNGMGQDDNYATIKANIKRLVNSVCRYRNIVDPKKIEEKERQITKYLWVVTRFNTFCEASNQQENKINFCTEINYNVLKTEVTCK